MIWWVLPSIDPVYRVECLDTMHPAILERTLVIDNTIHNRGVAASWNLGRSRAINSQAEWLVLLSESVRFGDAGGCDLEAELRASPADPWIDTHLGWHLVAFRTRTLQRVGAFDENFRPAYCVAPETRVLADDLRWIQAGDLTAGSGIVGVDEHPTEPRASRRYQRAEITSTGTRLASCVRIVMEDGREVTCTTDHKWLSKCALPTNTPYRWRPTFNLQAGQRIMAPLDEWPTDTTYEAGWLAGLYDGEGSLHISPDLRGVTLSQKEGAVLDRAKGILSAMGIPYTIHVRPDGVAQLDVNARRHVMALLGRLRPTRLLDKRAWDGMHLRSRSYPNDLRIEAIEPVGVREVVTLETTSSTYLAAGMVSHNCEDTDYLVRLHLAGLPSPRENDRPHRWITDLDVSHVGTEHTIREGLACVDLAACRAYYRRKWGADDPGHKYATPFDRPDVDWTWWPEMGCP